MERRQGWTWMYLTIHIVALWATTVQATAPILVYDGSGRLAEAMLAAGYTNGPQDPDFEVVADVTAGSLVDREVLVIGTDGATSMSGLHSAVLLANIRGTILLSGHDVEQHILDGAPGAGGLKSEDVKEAAKIFLQGAISYASGELTGLVVFGGGRAWSWYPRNLDPPNERWPDCDYGLQNENVVSEITEAGWVSGIYGDPYDEGAFRRTLVGLGSLISR